MARTSRFAIAALLIALLFGASFAYASSRSHDWNSNYAYNNTNNSYDWYAVDNSINHSYNDYNSNNVYAYGYPHYSRSDNSYRYYDYNYDYHNKPSCSIWIVRYGGSYGYDRTVQISWTSNYATSAYINNVGSVGVNGSQAIYYPFNDRYTMTVYGPGGSDTCSTQYVSRSDYDYSKHYRDYTYASYPNYVYTTPVYVNPYITLNQMPYTGFDFGPFGNSLYWVGMILAAALGAYSIVYGHSRALPVQFASEVAQAARNQIRFIRIRLR